MRELLLMVFFLKCCFICGQQVEIAVQKGHSADIQIITFNSDGNLLASAGLDNLIKLWHIPTGKEMASFISASHWPVEAMQFEKEDNFLYVRYSDGATHTWDIAASVLAATHGPDRIKNDPTRFYHSDSLHLVYIDGYTLRKKNKSGNIVFSKVPIDISRDFTSLAVSEKFNVIAAANADGNVYIYDLRNGKNLGTLEGHYSRINSVCFAPGEEVFATASTDRSVIIWDTKTLKPLKRLFGKSFRFETLAFNHAGTMLAIGDELGRGRIADLTSSRVRVSVSDWHQQKIADITFSPDDSLIFSGGFDNRLVSFSMRTNEVIKKRVYKNYVSSGDYFLKKMKAYREPYAWINTISISPQGTWIAAGGGWRESEVRKQPQAIQIINHRSNKTYRLFAHQGMVRDIHFANEINFFSAGSDGLIQWYYEAEKDDFYFRKKNTAAIVNIQKIIPVSANVVLLHSDKSLVLYDLTKEQMLDSIRAPESITAVDFNPLTGQLVYAVFNQLVFADLKDWHHKKITKNRAHTDKITCISFNPVRNMVATSSWDATVKLWRSSDAELLATIVSIGSDDHIIITPDNYYYGTKNSLRGIGFKYGKQFISPEQYDLRFNRPDIVLSRLGFVPKEVVRSFQRAYQKRLQKMNFTEQMLSEEIHLPQARAITDKLTLKVSDPKISFDVEAIDSKYKLDRINVFINNIPVYGIQGIDLRGTQGNALRHSVDLTLSAGKNKIQVSCLNEKGVESLLQTFEIEYTPISKSRPDLYVAVVSVSHYANETMNLKYARKDGQDLANMFKKSGWFNRVIIDTLYDTRATKENILKLRERFRQTTVDDQIVFFVSGHGLLDGNLDFYFATHDVDFKNPATNGLRYDELEGLLDGIPARKKLLLMDACHSGEVDKSRIKTSPAGTILNKNQRGTVTGYTYPADVQEEHYKIGITTSFELMQELFSNLSKGSGAVVIAAAAGNSFALESDEWRNGVFTYAILNGVKTRQADQNRNGVISVTELKDFVSTEVQQLTQGAQKPTSRRENLEFDFRIW